ncbi:MAG: Asp-tRNA(Asn)/Glu-tRNA(Gln) amidotransferase subunit GatB [candidate division NC10 bacterium]|nr:Asp-tRNA(Asn)/Glu-tRNA(Gln) amidotransferase subunit GatB [candidate division NC10 bacterium]
MKYETVIGLEVHAQLLTKSKMFCACSTKFGEPPNTLTCPICLGMPGVLPVINRRAVEFALKTALALHCPINPSCRFSRKHYFYPDMPKNFQISQYDQPLAQHGFITIRMNGESKQVGIRRVHLEEDVGKLVHAGTMAEAQHSYVDFNRSGVPLLEIVSEPEIHSPAEAAEYLRQLRAVLMYLEVCDGNMEEGSFRCDANISIRRAHSPELGVKTEVKNMNSFKAVQKALEYEVKRQIKILEEGGRIVQETRLWDADQEITLSMRTKEEAHDYRYFPEPDLLPLEVSPVWIEEIRSSLPELPEERRRRFVLHYGLPEYDAGVLTATKALANYFEECVSLHPQAKVVSNWVMVELLGQLNKDNREIEASPISPQALAELLSLMDQGVISGKIAKAVFEEMYQTGEAAGAIVKEKGLTQISDEEELLRIVEEVIAQNPGPVADYRAGKEKSFTYLVGQVMKATKGKANPQLANRLLRERLGEPGKQTAD